MVENIVDHKVVVKLYRRLALGGFTEYDKDNDIAFGLCCI